MFNTLNGVDAPLPLIDLNRISSIVTETYDHISEVYAEKHTRDFVLAQPLDAFARLLRRLNKHTVLDIGSGPGSEVSALLSRGFNAVGIDGSTKMVQIASQNVPQARFDVMPLQDLRFSEAAFDAIWSARTLIHVPKSLVIDMLVAWKWVLCPGGILGVSVIKGGRDGWGPEDYAPDRYMFNHYFAEGELEDALKAAGYKILSSQIVVDERDPDNPDNLFLFAQKEETFLDQESYKHYVHYNKEQKRWVVSPEDVERVIALHLHAGQLSPRQQVNLCVLYDQLAVRDHALEERYKLEAWKLKLHLQTPDSLSSEDFLVWFTLGKLHLKLTQFQHAVTCLERARQLQPRNFDTLVRLAYSLEGLSNFDKAIEVAHEAEKLADEFEVSDEARADLYHALGHFYVGRSHLVNEDLVIKDREQGERYMERACSTGEEGYGYLSCLGSIYNETKRYSDAIVLLDQAISNEKVSKKVDLHNELHFYRGEAFLGLDRYDDALANLNHVEQYARAKLNWDTLAHVKLYQVRTYLKRKDVSELTLDEIHSYLEALYQHEPSLYVVESFQHDRQRLINILSAFYLLKQCLDEQKLLEDFDQRLSIAIRYMEKLYDEVPQMEWDLLVLTDDTAKAQEYKFPCIPRLYGFDEIGIDLTERNMERYKVWGILALGENIPASTIANISYLIGRFYERGFTIYIYDPVQALPGTVRKTLDEFFVNSFEDLSQYCYMNILYDKSREYLGITKTPLGMAPIGVAPSLLAAQAETIDLLSVEEK
jgi:tetratricopeptide (TPR) repeat protein